MAEDTPYTRSEPEYLLTTYDNPFNPFTRFEEWLAYDARMGYNTPSFLARIAIDSHEISDPDSALSIDNAINEIVQENVSGMHRMVTEASAKALGLL
jgi:hypothetical protein